MSEPNRDRKSRLCLGGATAVLSARDVIPALTALHVPRPSNSRPPPRHKRARSASQTDRSNCCAGALTERRKAEHRSGHDGVDTSSAAPGVHQQRVAVHVANDPGWPGRATQNVRKRSPSACRILLADGSFGQRATARSATRPPRASKISSPRLAPAPPVPTGRAGASSSRVRTCRLSSKQPLVTDDDGYCLLRDANATPLHGDEQVGAARRSRPHRQPDTHVGRYARAASTQPTDGPDAPARPKAD